MSYGDGTGCLRNVDRAPSMVVQGWGHDADAYGDIHCSCAACIKSQHGPFSVVSLHSILHSFQWEHDFIEPFQALHNAIDLRGQVIHQSWLDSLEGIPCPIVASADQHQGIIKCFSSMSSVTAKTVTFDEFAEIAIVDEWQCQEVLFEAIPDLRPTPQCSILSGSSRCRYPLSHEAVSIRPAAPPNINAQHVPSVNSNDCELGENDDLAFFMQRTFNQGMQCKNSPHDLQQELRLQGFAQGHVGENNEGQEGDESPGVPADDSQSSQGSSSSSHVHAPHSSGDRQEVVMYHLMHPPFQVFLSWSSYEEMVSEIANHYSRDRNQVIDAYEVVADVQGLGENVVPVIVHLVGDVPLGQTAILVLCDTEFHAPRSQHNFQTGPDVSRQVMRVPTMLARQILLQLAHVHQHCHQEQGRCLVFHNNVRWPDYDEAPRAVAHGDYLRIVLPPSDSLPCDTVTLVDMRRQGMTEEEIINEVFDEEVCSGYSPSLLNDTEVQALATAHLEDPDDVLDVMQIGTTLHRSSSSHDRGLPQPMKSEAQACSLHDVTASCTVSNARTFNALQLNASPDESLTDEFLRYVHAANSADTLANDQESQDEILLSQPQWVQEIWEKWTSTADAIPSDQHAVIRVETWLTNPRGWQRCESSRIAELSPDFRSWERELLTTWVDRTNPSLPTHFAVVHPVPEDANPIAIAQLIIEQQPEPFSKSVVVTVYDSGRSGRPHSLALVVSDRMDITGVLLMIGLSSHCPPETPQNECSLWMGNLAIRRDQTINVRTGNAFRLFVKRGMRISLQQLLSFSDTQLREELRAAIWGEVYRRPNMEGLPADVFANNNPTHSIMPSSSSSSEPPDWSRQLREIFDTHATIENEEEGPVLYVTAWFVNGNTQWTNAEPRVARLDGADGWWRSELQFPWRDRIGRGIPLEFHVVSPRPPQAAWQSHVAHVILSQGLDVDQVAVLTTCTVGQGSNARRLQEAVVTNRYSAVSDLVGIIQHAQFANAPATVQRGDRTFPHDRTVQINPGDGLLIRIERPAQEQDVRQVNIEDETDDVQMLQNLHALAGKVTVISNIETPQVSRCALSLEGAAETEDTIFAFDPRAPVFVPNAQPLPAWAQVIEDIYQEWDANAFAWEGEARVAHFTTWYVAPGLGITHCVHSRRISLRADFWAWREQLRQLWRDVMQLHTDFDLALVYPPPAHLDPGVAGHIIITQHPIVDWSSVLISVQDPALNRGAPVDMAYAIARTGLVRDVFQRIGYLAECTHHAQCQVRIRHAWMNAPDHLISTDGDAIEVVVRRNIIIQHWIPQVQPPPHEADGTVLLQTSAVKRVVMPQARQGDEQGAAPEACQSQQSKVVHLESLIDDPTADIDSIPFTLALIAEQSQVIGQNTVICAWELHQNQTDFVFSSQAEFTRQVSVDTFRSRHKLIQPCSDLFPVRFHRPAWNISTGSWFIGSFVPPGHDQAIVACVEYRKEGATHSVATLPSSCDCCVVRSCLHVKHGSKIRINGQSVSGNIHLQHGDLLEYHAADKGQEISLRKDSNKVQICLEACLDSVTVAFDDDKDAVEILPIPDIANALMQADEWQFCLIPEGVNLHRSTYEALHVQHEQMPAETKTLELYVDGATADGCSAWAVVAVAVSENGHRLCGCIAGTTEINVSAPNWIGAIAHTNVDAELTAMTIATAFAFFGANDVPCVIRPDLALSRRFLDLESVTQQDSTVARVLHSLGYMLPHGISVSEVRAHRGDPWNELADSVAKWVTQTRQTVGVVPWQHINALATSPSNLRWEWLRHMAESMKVTMPHLHGNAVWQPAPSNTKIAHVVNRDTSATHDLQIQFRFATYNALALNDEEGTSWLPGIFGPHDWIISLMPKA